MNKIFKVIYSKTRHCYVVVSELAKSHCKTTQSHTVKSKTALTAAVLLALGIGCGGLFYPMQVEAVTDLSTNDYFTAYDKNYFDKDGNKSTDWDKAKVTNSDQDKENIGAKDTGAIAAGLYAQAGKQTITIGNRNAGLSKGSVYVGEYTGYQNPTSDSIPEGLKSAYVTSVGFMSNATWTGTVAIGANASAEGEKNNVILGDGDLSKVLSENQGIKGASVALGYSATAKAGNIAIGAYSDASTDLRTDTSDAAKSYLTSKTADSYVSVGKSDALRRISNVADGAADTDAATIAQLKKAVSETDASKKANIDASNIGKNLKKADGTTAAESTDITTNENKWGAAIGTGTVEKDNGQLVTGGTVYTALDNQKKDLSVHAGWGIKVAKDKDGNAISLNRNLGRDMDTTDKATLEADESRSALVLGGRVEEGQSKKGQVVEKAYGAFGQDSVVVGGANNIADKDGSAAVVMGGTTNTASAQYSTVAGGNNNDAFGNESSVFGGFDNDAFEAHATLNGGSMNRAYGEAASVFGGSMNSALGASSVAVGGLQSTVNGAFAVGIAGGSTNADHALAAGNGANVTVKNGTAIGYQATANKEGTIAFGHDKGDVSAYTVTWEKRTDGKTNADGSDYDYTKPIVTADESKKYTDAYYNRLVKVADGVDDHDVVVMEQLNNAKNDLTNNLSVKKGWGIKITDNGDNGKTIELERNLGNNSTSVTKVSDTGLILGGDFYGTYRPDEKYGNYGATGQYAVTLGGRSNRASGESSVAAGGRYNTANGNQSFVGGGNGNVATGSYSANLGGIGNNASGENSVVTGGAYNTANGTESFVGGGHGNMAVGNYSAVIGGWDNRALGDPYGSSITTVVGGYQNTANGYHAMVSGGYQNVAWGRDTLVSGGRYNTVLGEMEDGWTQQRLSDASAFGGEGSVVQGLGSVGLAGGSTGKTAYLALAAGYQSVVTDGAAKLEANFSDYGTILPVYKDIASAIGYQSTANEAGTISFGHDAGDVSGYTVKWEEDKDPTHDAIDYGSNDYTKTPTVTKNYYDDAYYNRLVKVADGIDNHDAVTREQVQYIGGIYGTDKNDSNYGGKGATGTNSIAIGSNSVATEDNVVSFGNPDIPAVNIPESQKITHSVSLSDADKTAINNVLGFDVTNDENWSKISGLKDLVIASSLGSATYKQDLEKLNNNHEFIELLKKVNTAYLNGTLTQEQLMSFEKYANGTEVETIDAVNIPAKAANYRRVVNIADGINPHDAVAMEQLEDYAKTDASNIGNKITVYKTDENGKSVEDTDATTTARNKSKDDWGEALGAGTLASSTAASNSDQLITGKTLYNYDAPVAESGKTLNYVSADKTTGQNLRALDSQVKANADALNKPNHNIKYYSVTAGPSLGYTQYTNENNDGAKGTASLAAGNVTHTDGVASTVVGSYSAVFGTGFQGATALSYGTVNVNNNTDTTKKFSGVANSIVGQANMTTNSNAAIIYGAGNTVTNSYRDIDSKKMGSIMGSLNDPEALDKALQDAVPTSGGQVMVMGGGNSVDNAYMTQVTGVGNTVKGNQVKNDKGEWVTDTSDTAIKDYDAKKSSQYNYVDGFNNEVINGKHDYVIGANNTVTGDSYDDKDAKKYSNESNIIFGDNHTVTNTKNAVIIGSSDTQMTLDKGDNATAIGHNASAQRDALAVGVNTQARGNAVALGTYSTAHNNSIAIGTKATAVSSQNLAIGWEAHIGNIQTDDEKIKNAIALGSDSQVRVNDLLESDNNRGVLSIGDTNKERRIIHVRAGVNDTDAVNVSQLKSAQNDLTDKGLTFAANSGAEYTAKLGSTVKIQGTDKKDNHEYTADNLTTEIDKDGKITILMDKDMSVEKLAVNGKDGKDGASGTPGSIGIKGQDGESGVGIDGKDGISIKGTDGKDGVTIKVDNGKDGKDGSEGHIGLNGRDGSSADIIVKKGYDDAAKGINGTNGVDGKDGITRIVYTDKTGEHQVATMEDGMKYAGDDAQNDTTKVIAKKLNNTLDIIGGADSKNLTDKNIGVNSTTDGKLKVQLAKDLTSITSISNQTTTGEGESQTTTGAKITLGTDGTTTITGGDVNVSGHKVTNVKDGALSDSSTEAVNGKQLYSEQTAREAADTAINNKIGSLADNGNYIQKDASVSSNLSTLDTHVKSNADAITNIENSVSTLDQNAVKYDDTTKGKVTLAGGEGGTTITNVKDGALSDSSTEAVNGKQLYSEQTARKAADTAINNKIGSLDANGNYIQKDASVSSNLNTLDTHVKSNADAITNIENSVSTLDQNAVKYDDTTKGKVTLAGGEGGTTITNVKDGALSDSSTEAVNGKQLYSEQTARKAADTAINNKIGSLDANGNYIQKDASVSSNLNTLDTQVKNNADAIQKNSESIQNITNNVKNLSDNAVQYDKDSNKSKVTLGGKDGTTITNVKEGALSDSSTDAVNGKQLYNEQQAREAADKAITEKVTNNTDEITKIKNGDFTDASKTAIHNIAKDAVEVVAGTNTTVTKTEGTDTTPMKYTVAVEGKGKVASGDTGLISGDTLYQEVHVDKDGSYIKSGNTVGQNLSSLDTGLKTTSDLIHTNDKGDTIQIGGNSTATKIDVSGKDANGNTTGRVITGVVSDANDPNSAANVGYVNGLTAANTQQIYRDMNNAYSRLDTNINRAAAGSNALAALHPLDFDPADKASFAVGYGHYHNANAAAVGAFYQPNANTMVNMGISLGNGDPGFNAGVSFKIGKGSTYNGVSKAEMAQTIHDQAAEISTIKANDAAKDKRIDALEKENQEMKKQIQEILARLNG